MADNGKNKSSMTTENKIKCVLMDFEINKITLQEATKQILLLLGVSGSLRFSEREVDFAYLCGVFNTSGIDGLHSETQRLKELGKEPHDIIEACHKQ